MRADDRALADLAASVADGQPIDWQTLEAKAEVSERRLVRHLRLVENIASLYRSIPLDEDEEAPAAVPGAADRMEPEPTGPRWGRLVMLDQIGRGASSDVFRAWDTELHREVALKLLHEAGDAPHVDAKDRRARMLDEARRLARVRHPHVVQVYGAEEHDGRVGLWMELVRGESLEQIVAGRGTFGAAEAAVMGQDLCAALAAVHGSGILHRDIKAQNVLRESGGRIVLMDFGTGEELRDAQGTARMAGTPLYVAPEIFGGKPATAQSDLYSLGVLIFYIVTGQFPVTAASIEQLARAHAHHQRRRLRDLRPELPSTFVHVVERALDPDPAARYRTAGEMEAALRERAQEFQPAAVTPRPWWLRITRTPGSAEFAVGAVAVVIALAAIVWSYFGGNRTPPSTSPPITSVAVLPLADISGSSTTPYLADALTDQLITTLGQVRALRVASRTSVMPFKDAKPSRKQVFDTLGVDALVEGTVQVVGGPGPAPGRVRVNARLITAAGGIQLWSKSLERPLGDTLALEAELAREIAQAVQATVTDTESRRLGQAHSTSPAADQAFHQGLYHLHQLGADNMRAAVAAFRRAIELDADHAPAHAGLARAYITIGFMGVSSQAEARANALAAASRAASLDADSSAAHEALADLKFYYDWDWPGAEAAYQKAIDLNPNSGHAHSQYARFLSARGRMAAAIEEADRSAALDPLSSNGASTQAMMHYYARDFDRALAAAAHALQLDPGSAGVHFVLARIHGARGEYDEAIQANTRALELAGRASTGWRAHLILWQALAGRTADARVGLRQLTNTVKAQNERVGGVELGYVQMALGNRRGALDLLGHAGDERDPDLLWLAVDPRAEPLHNDPRFGALLTRLGLPHLTRQ